MLQKPFIFAILSANPNTMRTAAIFLFFAFFVFTHIGTAQSGLLWSDAITIAPASYGVASPRITMLPGGNPAVVWGELSGHIWFSKWDNGAFTTPLHIETNGTEPGVYDFGGVDIAYGGQKLFIVFENFTQGIFVTRSDDFGASWQTPVQAIGVPGGSATTLSSIEVDADGNPIVTTLFQNSNETNAVVRLARSYDGGNTFTVFSDANEPSTGEFVCECCYQDILPGNDDTIYVAYRNNRNNIRDIHISRSSDGGESFDVETDVDSLNWLVNFCPTSGPRLARLSADTIVAAWMSRGTGANRVYVNTIHAGSMDFGRMLAIPGSNAPSGFIQNRPDVAAFRDTVALVWEETGFVNTSQDIVCAYSTTGVDGLPDNKFNVSLAPGTQKFPQITYQNGQFHLIYADPALGVVYRKGTPTSPVQTVEAVRSEIMVFPNPLEDHFSIVTELVLERLEMYAATGKLVMRVPSPSGPIMLPELPAGLYWLRIIGDDAQLIGIKMVMKK